MSSPSPSTAAPDLRDLRRRIGAVGLRDERRLRRRLDQLRGQRDEARHAQDLERLVQDVGTAEARVEHRASLEPRLDLPPELPVSGRADEIAAAISENQVVIVAGETGSGKTTQIPRILLGLGRGVRGRIGHTQPRRIAARTVAERIAEECGGELGGTVGYTVRFHDQVSDDTLVKVMTDGILLAEIRSDPFLRQYDTIIIDEAHERSLSIDFLLGYLKRLLPRRRDLKVVITSATIDPERFAALFDGAPIIEVSGRTFPVEVRYRPVVDRDDTDPFEAVADAVEELGTEGDGDVLVFLSGEREIRDATDVLNRRSWRRTEVLPLYGRLSAADQHKIFQPHTGRRVVLATNVAETSLTVPGIRYVVDAGTARISRYSQRLKVQRLPIEPVSQASANQRAGRCGRVADGICIRLYSEEDYDGRPEFTDPEILRTNLASVLLQMASADLGAVEDFPFMDPPDRRAVRDGVELLLELGALQPEVEGENHRLTDVGRVVAGLPLDPRLARMLVEAQRNDCLREVLVIVSGLSVQDPRERPSDAQQAADTKHARFADKGSDFASYLHLWDYLREQRKALSGSAFRRMCRDEYLHYLRVREWQDVHGLLRQSAKDLRWSLDTPPADADRVHQSLLAGLLSHVGLQEPEGRDYLGARGAKFAVFPGSALAKKPPRWVMAGELVETSRLWARTVARVDPAWVEQAASHLVKRSYSEPHWSKKRGSVMAHERVTLYGIPLAADRLVTFGSIDPVTSRDLFIRHALVQGEWDTRHHFFDRNRALLDDVEDLEERVRRRDIRIDDDTLFAFYDRLVPADVVSGRHFDTWWKQARRSSPTLLDLDPEQLRRDGALVDADAFPTSWTSGPDAPAMPLSYVFEPGTETDGVTVDVPLALLPRVEESEFAWNVPGHREELVTALIRTLPKTWRKQFVPAPDYARRVLERIGSTEGDLATTVADELRRMTGVVVPAQEFAVDALPPHLRPTFRVLDDGREVGRGKDLAALREELRPKARSVLSAASSGLEQTGETTWAFGTVPRSVTTEISGHQVTAYPTLVDRGTSVDLTVVESEDVQAARTTAGLARLIVLNTSSPVPNIMRALSRTDTLVLATSPYATVADLVEDCRLAAVEELIASAGGPVWDADAYARLREHVRAEVHGATERVLRLVVATLHAWGEVRQAMADAPPARAATVDDVRVQVSWLVFAGFVRETGALQLQHLPRYLKAATSRFADGVDVRVDAERTATVQDLEAELHEIVQALPEVRRDTASVRQCRWMLEELRVQLFAQRLRTAGAVSEKRVRKALDALR
ncbi:ATP-dependent RNA helicase HrpA [Solicola sp. PLA-1-18]|uniref:ATP-dependent RNA helicase HrpA n=1 Tax=Solicola sp. PLA-1-18 TaxID=3380532 RepID=UPI003B7FD277